MAELIYVTCALASSTCAVLLWKGYRSTESRLLFWSGLHFGLLAVANLLLAVDLILLPDSIDLALIRNLTTLFAIVVFLFGILTELI